MARGNLLEQLSLRNDVLEELLHGVRQLPKGSYPTCMAEYRVWTAADLGIALIGSKSSVSTTQQRKLGRDDVVRELARADGLVKRCKRLRAGRPGGDARPTADSCNLLKLQVVELTRERDAIAASYQELLAELQTSRDDLKRSVQKEESLDRRLTDLLRQINDGNKGLKLVSDIGTNPSA